MLDGATILITARTGPLGDPFLAMEKQYNVRSPKNLLQGDMSVITPEAVQHIHCVRARESGSEQIIGIEGSCFIYEYIEHIQNIAKHK